MDYLIMAQLVRELGIEHTQVFLEDDGSYSYAPLFTYQFDVVMIAATNEHLVIHHGNCVIDVISLDALKSPCL